ncbi:hypothetical protein KZX46_03965 [Polymorphobacter sp. PAMC 29334]|uniref:hypothetical protein n=1 Tax=Polymorphobacter sp. PAMC 29334 TaxID=2862331 RepID=UPI001C77723F|nr:hypothetical protein [Polymorphobacter sp. PAMC 29334]QYE35176.1 hypothetical protein KZX46_03965 [Polymorphobacter sp. PAMC 29334]
MARLWSGFESAGLLGTAPLFVLQIALFFAGLILFAAALPRVRPVIAALAIDALLIPAEWLIVVIKDAQMIAALTAATGIVAAYKLRSRAVPAAAAGVVAVLLVYAVLLRANAVFGVVPLVCVWAGWGGLRHTAPRAALMLAGVLAVLAVSPPINHRLLGARPSHVERVLPLYDLAGIAHFGGIATLPGLPVARWREAEARGCYHVTMWDAYSDPAECGFVADAVGFDGDAGAGLFGDWARAVAAHPVAYARHRLGHFNMTMRWLVPFGQPRTVGPPDSQPNDVGIGRRADPLLKGIAVAANALAATPFGWPAVWLAASLGLWWTAAGTPRSGPRDMALALALSAAAMLLSFAVVSIASDLRYHLWAMVATTLGGVALSVAPGVPRRRMQGAFAAIALAAAAGVIARLLLTPGTW